MGTRVIINEPGKNRKILLKFHNETNVVKIQMILKVNKPLICNANALNIQIVKYINNNNEPKLIIKILITFNKSIKDFLLFSINDVTVYKLL